MFCDTLIFQFSSLVIFYKTSRNRSNYGRSGQAFSCSGRIFKITVFEGPQDVKENNEQTKAKIKGFKEQSKAKIKCSKTKGF